MISVENITEQLYWGLKKHKATLLHTVKCALVVFVIAFLLESFVFNMNYFRSSSYSEVKLDSQIDLPLTDDEKQFKFTAQEKSVEFHNLNKDVYNIRLDFDNSQPAQDVTLSIWFTDEAHETYFSTTEYTFGVPDVNVATNNEDSQYIYLETSGRVDSLKIEITGDETSYPIFLNSISVNAPQSFAFNSTRFLMTAGLLALLYIFRPRSSIYRCYLKEHPRKTKLCTVLVTGIEIVLISGYLFMGSNLVGVATPNYNSGSWDGSAPITTFKTGGDNAQQYAELAKAMADGQLYLEVDPPQWLVDMDNPYDKGAREELQKQTGEEYLFDVAYYEGHYYVYFGVVPVLLFYLPFYLLTGASFPTAIGVLVSCIAFILGITGLLDRFALSLQTS